MKPLNLEDIKKNVHKVLDDSLLKPIYKKITDRHLTTGHCYAASEAVFHMTGGWNVWRSCVGKNANGETHWWLIDNKNQIFDVTSEQFTFFGNIPPYENGRVCPFLTKKPSKRAQEIINRLERL